MHPISKMALKLTAIREFCAHTQAVSDLLSFYSSQRLSSVVLASLDCLEDGVPGRLAPRYRRPDGLSRICCAWILLDRYFACTGPDKFPCIEKCLASAGLCALFETIDVTSQCEGFNRYPICSDEPVQPDRLNSDYYRFDAVLLVTHQLHPTMVT